MKDVSGQWWNSLTVVTAFSLRKIAQNSESESIFASNEWQSCRGVRNDRSYISTAGLRHGSLYSVQGRQKWWQV